jgi:hypothetical protein
MRRGVPVFLSLAFVGCGARTGLDDGPADSGIKVHADARTEVDTGARVEAGPRICPLTPPAANSACENRDLAVLCAYLDDGSSEGIEAWDCNFGSWVGATTAAYATFTTCSEIVCDSEVYVECVVGAGTRCCECSPDMTADLCGPC